MEENGQLETGYFCFGLSPFAFEFQLSAFLISAFAFSHATARGRNRREAGRLKGVVREVGNGR